MAIERIKEELKTKGLLFKILGIESDFVNSIVTWICREDCFLS